MRLIIAVEFFLRWKLATLLLDISTGLARLAREVAPRPVS